jgi:monoamine oxidase
LTVALGDNAKIVETQSDQDIQEEVMQILRLVFDAPHAPDPTKILVTRWGQEKFSRGSYSYNKVGATRKDFKVAGLPVKKTLFLAGEHTNPEYRGSVHGAYLSGIRVAKEVWDHDDDDDDDDDDEIEGDDGDDNANDDDDDDDDDDVAEVAKCFRAAFLP